MNRHFEDWNDLMRQDILFRYKIYNVIEKIQFLLYNL